MIVVRIVTLMGLSLFLACWGIVVHGQETLVPSDPPDQTQKAKDLAEAFRSASREILPTVVTVLCSSKEEVVELEQVDSDDDSQRFDMVGSGVIWSPEGLIVTNAHVVNNAKLVVVRLEDGREFKGHDVKADKPSDLAILKIDCPDPLKAAPRGNSEQLAVGDWVLAIGSPFNMEQTVSAGIISGKARVLRDLLAGQMLQTDAAINPGNSGGALVNLDGQVIGINTAIASRSGFYQGIGFAIPVSRVEWIASELASSGKVRRSRIGLTTNRIPQAIADELKLPVRGGVYVSRVANDQPADNAGVKVGDIVMEIAGQKARTPADFAAIVEQLPVGPTQIMKVMREGELLTLELSLVPRDE